MQQPDSWLRKNHKSAPQFHGVGANIAPDCTRGRLKFQLPKRQRLRAGVFHVPPSHSNNSAKSKNRPQGAPTATNPKPLASKHDFSNILIPLWPPPPTQLFKPLEPSPYYHITILSCRHIITSSYHHIVTSLHHHTATKIKFTKLKNLVIPAGVEPAIFWMRTRRPRPLDDGTTGNILTKNTYSVKQHAYR